MVQKELETQAAQLLEHCQYGLEQVEAEKLLLVAGKLYLFCGPGLCSRIDSSDIIICHVMVTPTDCMRIV